MKASIRLACVLLALVLSAGIALPRLLPAPEPQPELVWRQTMEIETDAAGRELSRFEWHYRADGRLKSSLFYRDGVLDKDGFSYRYLYDDAGRAIAEEIYSYGKWQKQRTRAFDDAGNLTEACYYNGTVEVSRRSYVYNDRGQLVEERLFENGEARGVWLYAYDGRGNQTQKRAPSGAPVTTTTYNERNQPLREQTVNAKGEVTDWTEYDYDDAGKLIAERSEFEEYDYGPDGKKCGFRYLDSDGEPTFWKTSTFDEQGRLIKTYTENLRGRPYSRTAHYSYDAAGNLVQCGVRDENGELLSYLNAAYDADGRLLFRYSYEGTDIGLELHHEEYYYDENGVLLNRRSGIGGSSIDSYAYRYDDAGTLVSHLGRNQDGMVIAEATYAPDGSFEEQYTHYAPFYLETQRRWVETDKRFTILYRYDEHCNLIYTESHSDYSDSYTTYEYALLPDVNSDW